MADVEEPDGEELSIEERARAQGWVPKEEFKGDQARWRPAEEFVKRGEEIASFRPEVVRKLEAKVAGLERQIDRNAEFYTKQQERAYQRALDQVRKDMEAAVETGDKDAFKAAQKQEDALRKEVADAKPQKDAAPQVDDGTREWLEENTWFDAPAIGQKGNKRATAYALAVAQEAEEEGLKGAALYSRVTKEVKERFPDLFENPSRRQPSPVEGADAGRPRAANGKGRTAADLPAEARRIMKETVERMQKKNPKYSESDWLAQYEW